MTCACTQEEGSDVIGGKTLEVLVHHATCL